MAVTFDGTAKLIICTPGTTTISVQQVYEDWKTWVLAGNAGYLPAFRVVGGDPTTGANVVASYFFLTNGWRVRPQEASHMLSVSGSLVVDGGGNPYVPTLGAYNVQVIADVPVKAEGISTSGSSPTDIAAALLDNEDVEINLTVRKALRLFAAALGGRVSGAATETITFRNAVADSKPRIVAHVDADGNRSVVTTDLT